jgi:hypothetical protein
LGLVAVRRCLLGCERRAADGTRAGTRASARAAAGVDAGTGTAAG